MARIASAAAAGCLCSRCDFAGAAAAKRAGSAPNPGSRSCSPAPMPAHCRPGSPTAAAKVHLENYGRLQLAAANYEVKT